MRKMLNIGMLLAAVGTAFGSPLYADNHLQPRGGRADIDGACRSSDKVHYRI